MNHQEGPEAFGAGQEQNPAEQNEELAARKAKRAEQERASAPSPVDQEVRRKAHRAALNNAREHLGLPPLPEPEQEATEGSPEQEEAAAEDIERRIQEEKEKLIKERLDQAFEELKQLAPDILASLLGSGRTPDGQPYQSKSLGQLDAKSTQSLAQALEAGIQSLPELMKMLPDLLASLDQELTEEATNRVTEQMKTERDAMAAKPAEESSAEEDSESEDFSFKTDDGSIAIGEGAIAIGANQNVEVNIPPRESGAPQESAAVRPQPERQEQAAGVNFGDTTINTGENGTVAVGPGAIALGANAQFNNSPDNQPEAS